MPPGPPARRPRKTAASGRPSPKMAEFRAWLARGDRRARLLKLALVVFGGPAALGLIVATILWISYGRMIDSRLGGEQKPIPRIYARPFELRPGEGLTLVQIEQRLNDIGYTRRDEVEQPGQFSIADGSVVLMPRITGRDAPRLVRVDLSRGSSPVVTKLTSLP